MDKNLTKALVDNKILKPNMLVGIATRYPNDFKTYKIKSIHHKMGMYTFLCGGQFDDVRLEQDIPEMYIVQIEGMSLKRFAETHHFHVDGTPMKVGKKRGRKPKNRVEQ